jgi:hypothetical protein
MKREEHRMRGVSVPPESPRKREGDKPEREYLEDPSFG